MDSPQSHDAAKHKIKAFRKAGITVLNHIGNIGRDMATEMKNFKQRNSKIHELETEANDS